MTLTEKELRALEISERYMHGNLPQGAFCYTALKCYYSRSLPGVLCMFIIFVCRFDFSN
jgi:hypothetical protein